MTDYTNITSPYLQLCSKCGIHIFGAMVYQDDKYFHPYCAPPLNTSTWHSYTLVSEERIRQIVREELKLHRKRLQKAKSKVHRNKDDRNRNVAKK